MTEINSLSQDQVVQQKARALKQTLNGPVDIAKGSGESIWGALTLNGDKIKDGAKTMVNGVLDVPLGIANFAVGTIKKGECTGIFEKASENNSSQKDASDRLDPEPVNPEELALTETLLIDPSDIVVPD